MVEKYKNRYRSFYGNSVKYSHVELIQWGVYGSDESNLGYPDQAVWTGVDAQPASRNARSKAPRTSYGPSRWQGTVGSGTERTEDIRGPTDVFPR